MYVENTAQLSALLVRAREDGRLGVDLEFIRDRTYFAQLALVQLAVGDTHVLIDPLGPVDLAELDAVMLDPGVTKVLHAASQDLEIFFHRTGQPARNVFDVQAAAALLGLGRQIAYGALVGKVMGVQLEKGESYTDWLRRPLTANQERYALDDVVHLLPLHDRLRGQLVELGREPWLRAECASYEEVTTYAPDPATLYRKVKRHNVLKPRQMAALRELAIWREDEAVRRDRPRRSVVGDEVLIEIARKLPRRVADLNHTRGLHPNELRQSGSALVAAVGRGLDVPDDALPRESKRPKVSDAAGLTTDLADACLRTLCDRARIDPSMITNRAGLERLVVEHRRGDKSHFDSPILTGWRGEIVGLELLAVLEGRTAIYLDPESGRPAFEART